MDHVADRPLDARVGVACSADPEDASAFSGIPAGLLRGLRAQGLRGVPLTAALGPREPRVRKALAVGHVRPRAVAGALRGGEGTAGVRRELRAAQGRLIADPALARLRTRAAAASVDRAGSLTGAIQYGTDFRLPPGLPYVTYDDQTVVQAAEAYGYGWTTALGARELRRLRERQRRVFAGAVACCATSHWAARSIMEDYGIDPARVHVVGVGTARPAVIGGGRERDWSRPRFLLVGKDWERKNGARVLEAFATIRERHPEARLDVVGNHPELDAPGVTGHGFLNPSDEAQRDRV
jgi:hypothetical protein